jgi:hypothetical protein
MMSSTVDNLARIKVCTPPPRPPLLNYSPVCNVEPSFVSS